MRKEEIEKLRQMKFGEKIEYLWNNYMAQIVLIFFLLIVGVMAGNFAYQKLHPHTDAEIALLDYDAYAKMLESDGVVIETFQGLSAKMLESPDYGDLRMGLLAKIATGDLDGLIASKETIEKLQRQEGETFCTLTDIYDKEELERMQDKILYLQGEDGSLYPVGIALKDAKCLADASPKVEDIYLVFTLTGQKKDTVRKWIEAQ